jgi:acyl carrier protein
MHTPHEINTTLSPPQGMTDSRNKQGRGPGEVSTMDQLASVLAEYVPVMPTNRPLAEELSLRQDLALDSLALVSVLVRLGDDFGIDVADHDFELAGIETVGDLHDLLKQLARAATN